MEKQVERASKLCVRDKMNNLNYPDKFNLIGLHPERYAKQKLRRSKEYLLPLFIGNKSQERWIYWKNKNEAVLQSFPVWKSLWL